MPPGEMVEKVSLQPNYYLKEIGEGPLVSDDAATPTARPTRVVRKLGNVQITLFHSTIGPRGQMLPSASSFRRR